MTQRQNEKFKICQDASDKHITESYSMAESQADLKPEYVWIDPLNTQEADQTTYMMRIDQNNASLTDFTNSNHRKSQTDAILTASHHSV